MFYDEEGHKMLSNCKYRSGVVQSYVCILSHACCVLSPPCSSSLSPGVCGEAVTGVHAEERTRPALRPAVGVGPLGHRADSLLVPRPHLGAELPHRHPSAWSRPDHGLPQDTASAQPSGEEHGTGTVLRDRRGVLRINELDI